jgi:hypothetical protein
MREVKMMTSSGVEVLGSTIPLPTAGKARARSAVDRIQGTAIPTLDERIREDVQPVRLMQGRSLIFRAWQAMRNFWGLFNRSKMS